MPWQDTGSMTIIAEGNSLKDGSNVLAKIAPAQSNGSLYLEREAHMSVERLSCHILPLYLRISLSIMSSSPDRNNTTLRMIDFIKIPRESGDCVVLLLFHPGLNLLGRYLPPLKMNDLLLADSNRTRPSAHGDVYMIGPGEPGLTEEMEGFDIMDLASFIEQGFYFLVFNFIS